MCVCVQRRQGFAVTDDNAAQEQALVRRMLAGEEQAAREVVLAALTKAMRRLADFRGEAALFTWLCQICRREVVDYLRAHKRYSDRVVLIEDSPDLRAAIDAIEAPEEFDLALSYSREELGRVVRTVLDRLPPRYGDALEWKYVEGRSVEEIGARLGIGSTAAQSLLARAREAFRQAIETVFGAAARDIREA
jgi:RNA polymerase sigma-70 factor (ECF subfamily)